MMMIPAMIRALDVALAMSGYNQSAITFLKHGPLLPARRCRRLFLELLALSTALSAAFYLFKRLALAAGVADDLYPGLHDMDIVGVSRFADAWVGSGSDGHRLLSLAYLVTGFAVASVTYIAAVSAAVMARRHDDSGQAQEHLSLFSFLGTVRSNLGRPAKIVAVSCVLKAAFFMLLGLGAQVFGGAPGGWKQVILFPVALVYLLLESVASVAVVVSVAEKPAGQSAVGRACRLVRGRYKELLHYQTAQGVILNVFLAACALVAMVGSRMGLPQQVGAGVTCLLLGAREVFSAANVAGYYFTCRDKEEEEQTRACHLD